MGRVLLSGWINDIIKMFAEDGKRDLRKPRVRKEISASIAEDRLPPAFVIGTACKLVLVSAERKVGRKKIGKNQTESNC